MNNRFIQLFLLVSLPAVCLFGQAKYEREYRIKESAVPPEARAFVDALQWEGRVIWYQEEGRDQKSVEAKTRHRKKQYSIEFSLSGEIQDIEVKTGKKEVSGSHLQAIEAVLSRDFSRLKISKIQTQYSGEAASLLRTMRTGTMEDGITTRYEITVKGKEGRITNFYEYTFSENGHYLKRSVILFRNADNLEY